MTINFDLVKLLQCFPGSILNSDLELIVNPETNDYIVLRNCESDMDVKCRVIEGLSRSCYKTAPYSKESLNDRYHASMSRRVNEYLETCFDEEDFELIYTELGNGVNKKLTIRFVQSNYDTELLKEESHARCNH